MRLLPPPTVVTEGRGDDNCPALHAAGGPASQRRTAKPPPQKRTDAQAAALAARHLQPSPPPAAASASAAFAMQTNASRAPRRPPVDAAPARLKPTRVLAASRLARARLLQVGTGRPSEACSALPRRTGILNRLRLRRAGPRPGRPPSRGRGVAAGPRRRDVRFLTFHDLLWRTISIHC